MPPPRSARPAWKHLVPLAALLLLLGTQPVRSAPAAQSWEPAKTWVIVVGVLEWKDARSFGSFPKENRRDAELVKLFKEKGVPEDHVVFLKDKQATRARIDKALADVLPRSGKDDLLVLYYAGHGGRINAGTTYFANYDATGDLAATGWSIPSIFDAIEANFHGSRAWLMADCCNSGALVLEAKQRKSAIAYACLTSAHANTISTGNWTFTECVLAGLRGEPLLDLNGDGSVTLAELARYTEAEMAFYEQQMSAFGVTGRFSQDLRLAEAAGPGPTGEAGKRVEVKWQGKWYRARIEEVKDKQYKVHYFGFDRSEDEWVGPDRVRVPEPKHLEAGTAVEVKWGGRWWPAHVVEGKMGLHLIHYDDYSDDWDEWVTPQRLRMKR
jgi:Caspase domain/RNA binding activity-knot of a chromodomain